MQVLTIKIGKQTTGIGADTKISIGWYRYPPILAGIDRPIPDTQYQYRSNPSQLVMFGCQSTSVIFVNENEDGEKRENNEFVNEN